MLGNIGVDRPETLRLRDGTAIGNAGIAGSVLEERCRRGDRGTTARFWFLAAQSAPPR